MFLLPALWIFAQTRRLWEEIATFSSTWHWENHTFRQRSMIFKLIGTTRISCLSSLRIRCAPHFYLHLWFYGYSIHRIYVRIVQRLYDHIKSIAPVPSPPTHLSSPFVPAPLFPPPFYLFLLLLPACVLGKSRVGVPAHVSPVPLRLLLNLLCTSQVRRITDERRCIRRAHLSSRVASDEKKHINQESVTPFFAPNVRYFSLDRGRKGRAEKVSESSTVCSPEEGWAQMAWNITSFSSLNEVRLHCSRRKNQEKKTDVLWIQGWIDKQVRDSESRQELKNKLSQDEL